MYFLQVSAIWIVLYLCYYFGMKKLTFFQNNRLFLMSSLILGLIVPLLAPLIIIDKPETFIFHYDSLEAISTGTVINQREELDWHKISTMAGWLLYTLGVSFMFIRLVSGLKRIYKLYRSADKVRKGDFIFAYNEKPHLPFSFMNVIFLSRGVDFGEKLNKVIVHEITHVRQWHSIDVLITEILQVFFWFNPVLIFYKKSLKDAHEYLADQTVVSQTDYRDYIHLLMHTSSNSLEGHLVNSFFNSQIKNRIAMLSTNHSNPRASLRYIILIPMIGLFTYLLASGKLTKHKSNNIFQKESVASMFSLNDTLPNFNKTSEVVNDISKIEKPVWKNSELVYRGITYKIINKEINGAFDFNEWSTSVKFNEENSVTEITVYKKFPNKHKELFIPPSSNTSLKEEIFKIVEEMPRFPGCEDPGSSIQEKDLCAKEKLMAYIGRNIAYNSKARENGVEGTAVVQFTIKKNGKIEDVVVLKDPGSALGEDAKKVITSMKDMTENWIPGRQKGVAVDVQYTVPVKFKLNSSKTTEDNQKGNVFQEIEVLKEGGIQKIKAIKNPSNSDVTLSAVEKEVVVVGHSLKKSDQKEDTKLEEEKETFSKQPLTVSGTGLKPLMIIDGKKAEDNQLKKINPSDIQSINVHKSKEALLNFTNHPELYGGLIVVTTKSAKKNQEKSIVSKYFIDGKLSDQNELSNLKPGDIEIMEVVKGKGKNEGSIFVKTKGSINNDNLKLEVIPNPAPRDRVNIDIRSISDVNPVILKVYDAVGKLIHSQSVDLSEGKASAEINLSGKTTAASQVLIVAEQGKNADVVKAVLNN